MGGPLENFASALTKNDPGLLGKNDPLGLSAPPPESEWTHTVNLTDLACAKQLPSACRGDLTSSGGSVRVR